MHRCRAFLILLALSSPFAAAGGALAFGGFYVGKADSGLFNQSAKIVLAHHTVITMVADYQGALQEFAIVVPVPEVPERGQIHVTGHAIVEHLDAYGAPRLVEQLDADPCLAPAQEALPASMERPPDPGAEALGVEIEAQYAAGEYDILILSAEQSAGLMLWLRENGYRLPADAEAVLSTYIADGMRFFLARVNLEEQSKLGYSYLRPLQVAFESEQLVLPIRLGMLNAAGPQELLVFLLTRGGRAEPANYRTVEMPSDIEVPLFVKSAPGGFYTALFDESAAKEDMPAVFLEYASEMGACDPCTAGPPSFDQLRELGVFWMLDMAPRAELSPGTETPEIFVTRLHLRYDAERFPEDLRFRETGNRSRFQARYVLRHPWRGPPRCEAARQYLSTRPDEFERQAQNLARLTDRPIQEIRDEMEANGQPFASPDLEPDTREWWERIWPDNQPEDER
jgi:hypothetical protein